MEELSKESMSQGWREEIIDKRNINRLKKGRWAEEEWHTGKTRKGQDK